MGGRGGGFRPLSWQTPQREHHGAPTLWRGAWKASARASPSLRPPAQRALHSTDACTVLPCLAAEVALPGRPACTAMPQRLKRMKDYLRQLCEDAAKPHLDTITG